MKLGFTGTRNDPTDAQVRWLKHLFEQLQISEGHHGACVGSDLAFHRLALEFDVPLFVHPPTNPKYLATECLVPRPNVTVLPAKPYFNRNRDIGAAAEGLVGLPKHEQQPSEDQWGGTWYTIEYTHRRLNKPVMLCYPSGRTEKRDPRKV